MVLALKTMKYDKILAKVAKIATNYNNFLKKTSKKTKPALKIIIYIKNLVKNL